MPLRVDGRRVGLRGERVRGHASTLAVWLGLLAVVLAAGGVPLLARRHEQLRSAAVRISLVSAAAAVVVALSFAVGAYASPGTRIESVDELAFIAVGLAVLRRGGEHLRVVAAIGLGLVGLAAGLLDGAVFFHPIVLGVLPGTVTPGGGRGRHRPGPERRRARLGPLRADDRLGRQDEDELHYLVA